MKPKANALSRLRGLRDEVVISNRYMPDFVPLTLTPKVCETNARTLVLFTRHLYKWGWSTLGLMTND